MPTSSALRAANRKRIRERLQQSEEPEGKVEATTDKMTGIPQENPKETTVPSEQLTQPKPSGPTVRKAGRQVGYTNYQKHVAMALLAAFGIVFVATR